jgi:hypothetical protein
VRDQYADSHEHHSMRDLIWQESAREEMSQWPWRTGTFGRRLGTTVGREPTAASARV